jgi:hypothetical protein
VGVLVANSSFPSSRGSRCQTSSRNGSLRTCLQQLDRDEIEAFIRYQLPPDGRSNLLTANVWR